jgi:hypothetical protein
MRFIHQTEYDARLICEVGCNLAPSLGEDGGRGAVLANDTTPPTAIVVDVDASSSCQKAEWRDKILGSTHMQ